MDPQLLHIESQHICEALNFIVVRDTKQQRFIEARKLVIMLGLQESSAVEFLVPSFVWLVIAAFFSE